jgi:cell division protease FtsH
MNEAALLAARRQACAVAHADLEAAVEKVIAGPERRSRRLDEDERIRVAYHEVGHALVAAFSEHADPVHKISIIPRGRAALGYTMQLPTEQQFLLTRAELLDRIRGLLGGRAAEELVFADVSTGGENDLERATALARQMVCLYGMSDAIGLMHCGQRQSQFLPGPGAQMQKTCSDETEREIDTEVKKILADAYSDARKIVGDRRAELELIARQLIEKETIDRESFESLLLTVDRPKAGDTTEQRDRHTPSASPETTQPVGA